MSHNCVFRAEFFEDAQRARDWYEHVRSGLGYRFADCLNATIESVAEMPEMYSLIDRVTRVAVIRPFSYGVYFRIADDQVVFLAVFHLHRKPGLWRRRR
jgi:plasmid stabilization system protein ParE